VVPTAALWRFAPEACCSVSTISREAFSKVHAIKSAIFRHLRTTDLLRTCFRTILLFLLLYHLLVPLTFLPLCSQHFTLFPPLSTPLPTPVPYKGVLNTKASTKAIRLILPQLSFTKQSSDLRQFLRYYLLSNSNSTVLTSEAFSGIRTGERNKRETKWQRNKNHSTQDSHVVPLHGTSWAALCLTAQIRRDAVLSKSYGRGCNNYFCRGLLFY
jgi:hypothetical protein